MRSLGVYFLVKIVKPKLAKRALQINVCSGFCFSFPCAIVIFIYFSFFFCKQAINPFILQQDVPPDAELCGANAPVGGVLLVRQSIWY